MPTQLKVNALTGYNTQAPFTVNFASPIIIKPGQKIALDKFSAVVNGITTGFYIPENQKFDMYLAVNAPAESKTTITVPPGPYPTLADLLSSLTIACNAGITAYLAEVYPITPLIRYYRDRGLKVVCGTNNNAFQFQYLTVAPTTVTLASTGMSQTVGTPPFLFPSGGAGTVSWSARTPTTFPAMLTGGGASVEFQFYPSTTANALVNTLNYKLGLVDTYTTYRGVCQNQSSGYKFSLINESAPAGQQIIEIVAPGAFTTESNVFCQMYLLNGYFTLRCFRRIPDPDTGTNEEVELYNSSISPETRYFLGTMDYSQTYYFSSVGSNTNTVVSRTPAFSSRISMTCDLTFNTGGVPPPVSSTASPIPVSPPPNGTVFTRTMALDFTGAGILRAGFGVPSGQILLTPNNSWWGAYFNSSAINMSSVQSTFDLALELLDIPLQSYAANSDGKPGSRTNVLCYFHPELSNTGTDIYVYTASSYQWLDIDISYPLNLSSLSCRVYNPSNNLPLDAQSLSFNLMIDDSAY